MMNHVRSLPKTLLRIKQITDKTKLSSSTIWRKLKEDPTFPKPFQIGPRTTVWDEQEILMWMANCKKTRILKHELIYQPSSVEIENHGGGNHD